MNNATRLASSYNAAPWVAWELPALVQAWVSIRLVSTCMGRPELVGPGGGWVARLVLVGAWAVLPLLGTA